MNLALRVLKTALPCPKLTQEDAMTIIDYYLRRNRTARKSHRKTWLQIHKTVKFKQLL